MLIWMNQGPTLQGDYLSLTITEGKPELSFNLGKQTRPVRITSKVILRRAQKLQFFFNNPYFSIFIFRQELMTENGTDYVFYAKDELVFCKLINRNQAEVDLKKAHPC